MATGSATCGFDENGVAVGDGWLAIIDELATEIERLCAAAATPLPKVLKVKEKLSTIRVYVNSASDECAL